MRARMCVKPMTKATAKAFATELQRLSTLANEIKTDVNLTLAKMDADAGITDTNYTATNAIGGTSTSIT